MLISRLLGKRMLETKEDDSMTKKLRFEDKLKKKIDESNNRRNELEKNKECYRKQLKDKIIGRIEKKILEEVPCYIEGGELSLEGPIFFVKKNGNKLYIDYKYDEPDVFFDDIEDVEEFVKEIVTEFEKGLEYELKIYEMSEWTDVGYIQFKYEYKES